jgi:hypothetical protein
VLSKQLKEVYTRLEAVESSEIKTMRLWKNSDLFFFSEDQPIKIGVF